MAKKESAKLKNTNKILIEMLMLNVGKISDIIERQGHSIFGKANILSTSEINDYSLEFLELIVTLLQAAEEIDRRGPEFKALRKFFNNFSQQIQARGGNLDEFVRYVQFLQRVFIEELQEDKSTSFEETRKSLLLMASIFNDIVLDVFHTYIEVKERTIQAQQEELRQTSTPITEIWDGVLSLPIIGSLDSSRTMVVMEKLLSRIEEERARVVVIDVTGVLAIDTQVSRYLIQMVHAIGLMGATAILTGIRPEIARALTSLNIDMSSVTTMSTLADGLKEAFRRTGTSVSRMAS
jgi:rsbT co-antagonist protein RsbR